MGLIASVVYFLVLAFPLVAVIALPSMSAATTIAVYTVGLITDVVLGIVLLLVGLRYSARAARGELFSIPVVTSVVDRWVRVKRP